MGEPEGDAEAADETVPLTVAEGDLEPAEDPDGEGVGDGDPLGEADLVCVLDAGGVTVPAA